MALGIGLLMPPGPDGRPTAVYLIDMQAVCGACGKEALRRYFLSTPFHSLTLRKLERLFDAAPDAIEGVCEQCDAELQPEDVERWSLQYAPADGQGLLLALAEREGETAWRAVPHDHLDVQSQPVWSWDRQDISVVALPSLNEVTFTEAFARAMNPKSVLRQAILAFHDRSHQAPLGATFTESGACVVEAAPGLEFWIGSADGQHQAVASRPLRATHALLVEDGTIADGYPDAPARWLGDLATFLSEISVVAFVDPSAADASLRRHFHRFPIDLQFEDAGDILRVIAGDGADDHAALEFQPHAIAKEAARTGAAPGDIARAEIDRALTLLDFTNPV